MEKRYFACDLETYVSETHTYAWSVANVELFDESNFVDIDDSLDSFFHIFYGDNLGYLPILYFHNLKFDGSFIVDWLLKHNFEVYHGKGKLPMTFRCSISPMGQWYSVKIYFPNNIVEIRDSLKLLPFSLRKLGDDFNTPHKKLDMLFENKTSLKDCSKEDLEYIKNDVLVMKEALEIMLEESGDKLTIGSACLEHFKSTLSKSKWNLYFEDLTQFKLNPDLYGSDNVDSYIRKGYRGGYCYVHRQGKFFDGSTYDYNSMYPSNMHSDSGNYYPVGLPNFWKGNYIPDEVNYLNRVYIIRIQTRFKLKIGYLPTLQIKDNIYPKNNYLVSSDMNGETEYIGKDGIIHQCRPIITLTSIDFELLKTHYNLYDFEVLDGCWFNTEIGIFDDYIDYWRKKKEVDEGAQRAIDKLFSNNLYGKLATSPDSSFRIPYLKDGIVRFETVHESNKKTLHIGMGVFVTAYARRCIITSAQENIDDFCYADTDSLHLTTRNPKGLSIHPTHYQHWAWECDWNFALFVRQKTYVEYIVDCPKFKQPFYDLKAAGCPPRCKDLFLESIDGRERIKDKSEFELEWVKKNPHVIEDFKEGLSIPGKLRTKRVEGGIVLLPTTFTIK